jgi:hypothetical protein
MLFQHRPDHVLSQQETTDGIRQMPMKIDPRLKEHGPAGA